MGMSIGELFVNLGIKGTDQATRAISSVKSGLLDVSTSGLAAKAAVIGIIYAVEQLTIGAAQMGAGFKQFGASTGLGLEQLQKWQQFLLPFNVQGKQVESTLQGIQSMMFKVSHHMAAPPIGLRFLGIDPETAKDPYKVLKKVFDYVRGEKDVARANEVAGSMGVPLEMIAAFRRAKGDLNAVKAPMSESEIERLDRINQKWQIFTKNVELLKAHFAASFGGGMIDTIQRALTLFDRMATTFNRWGASQKGVAAIVTSLTALFAALAVVGGPITALSAAITGLIYLMSEYQKKEQGGDSWIFGSKKKDKLNEAGEKMKSANVLESILNHVPGLNSKDIEGFLSPVRSGGGVTINNSQNNNINQNIQHQGDHRDTGAVGNTHKAAAKSAYIAFPTVFQYT